MSIKVCDNLLRQVNPSPENPLLQAQENEPGTSVHIALVSQGLELHSSMSETREYYKLTHCNKFVAS